MCSPVFCFDGRIFRSYKPFPFKSFYVFLDCIVAHIYCFTNGGIAWIALMRLSIFAVHKVRIYEYLTWRKTEIENAFRHWKICAWYISFVVIVFQYKSPYFKFFEVLKLSSKKVLSGVRGKPREKQKSAEMKFFLDTHRWVVVIEFINGHNYGLCWFFCALRSLWNKRLFHPSKERFFRNSLIHKSLW